MKKWSIILFLLIFTKILFSQPTEITKFPYTDSTIVDAQPLNISESNCMLTYLWKQKLYASNTTNNGTTWTTPQILKDVGSVSSYTVLRTSTGRLIIIWATATQFFKIHSDDSGTTWSTQQQIGATVFNPKNVILTQTSDNTLWLTHSRAGNLYISKSSDDGSSWSSWGSFLSTTKNTYLSINSVGSGKLLAVFQDNTSGNQDIFYSKSNDNGITWSLPLPIISSIQNEEKPQIVKNSSGLLQLIYQIQKPTPFPAFHQYDIHYLESANEGESWSASFQFTRYVDDDIFLGVEIFNDKPLIIFHSKRFSTTRSNEIAFGFLGVTIDATPPPAIFQFEHSTPSASLPLYIKIYVHDDNAIAEVKAEVLGGDAVILYDDGLHNDEAAGDFIYGNFINTPEHKFLNGVSINNIKLPLDNRGILADVSLSLSFKVIVKDIDHKTSSLVKVVNFSSGGRFAESAFLFAGGFMLSGYSNNFMWANGVASASRITDYQAGIVGSVSNDPKNKLYLIRRTDPHFGSSWQAWLDAVSLGANFYDGDNDGLYDPVDKNNNGKWDPNEDMPDILGDETFWCVYNDGVPAGMRRYNDVPPQGIEVRQTVFASKRNPNLENVIFIRYSFLNKGTVVNKLDSVFFGIWTDPDLGDYVDDLVGSDTLLNSGFCYNEGIDNNYGNNPPAFYSTIIQQPWVYTGNNLDTAYNYLGQNLGLRKIAGYKKISSASFVNYMSSHPTQGDPGTRFDVRNYMLGYNRIGQLNNPCTWVFGTVTGGVNCASINPRFIYSGDPVTNIGWINNTTWDQRYMFNTGPFALEINKPIDIIVAYVVGRGTDALNSVHITRGFVQNAFTEYYSNFGTTTGIDDENLSSTLPVDFKLYQNYPNPFNPSTTIKFSTPHSAFVTLKVYDIIGREVATLVDEVKEAGVYNSTFSTLHSAFSTGVYFYELRSGSHVESKKMMLIK